MTVIFLPVLLSVGLAQGAQSAGADCSFTVSAVAARPEITGPPEAVLRATVVDQPDSPLRIVRVDLSQATLGEAAGGVIGFDVQNASNRIVRGGSIGFTWRVGYVPTAGSARFTGVLGPAAIMRLDARLPGPNSSGVTATAVAMSVRSANFDGCTFEPAQAATTVPGTSVFVEGATGDACAFTVPAHHEQPEVTGAPDLLARLNVVPQPGSPLRIRRIDVSRLHLNIGEGWLQVRGTYTIDVENVSNRPIEKATVALFTRARGAAGGDGPTWNGTLGPGKRMELRQQVARIADFPPGATGDDVKLLAAIDRVWFDRCTYQPARTFIERQ